MSVGFFVFIVIVWLIIQTVLLVVVFESLIGNRGYVFLEGVIICDLVFVGSQGCV